MKTNLVLFILLSYFSLVAFQWPLSHSSTQDSFTSAYGPRTLGTTQNPMYDHHGGMDLAAAEDTDVYPAHSGTARVVWDSQYSGNYVYVNTIYDYSSIYCHLNDIYVTDYQVVTETTVLVPYQKYSVTFWQKFNSLKLE